MEENSEIHDRDLVRVKKTGEIGKVMEIDEEDGSVCVWFGVPGMHYGRVCFYNPEDLEVESEDKRQLFLF